MRTFRLWLANLIVGRNAMIFPVTPAAEIHYYPPGNYVSLDIGQNDNETYVFGGSTIMNEK